MRLSDFALEYGLFVCGKKRILVKSVIDIRTIVNRTFVYQTKVLFLCIFGYKKGVFQ